MRKSLTAVCIGVAALSAGCKEDNQPQGTGPAANTGSGQSGPTATRPGGTAAKGSGEHPNRVPLGETTVGGLKLAAAQDEPVKPGGEGAFDLVITGGRPKAVRFWVGTEDAKGSVKAKAEEETPDHWHTHAEVPNPLPPGSKFWAEVEPPTGDKFTVSFDMKVQ